MRPRGKFRCHQEANSFSLLWGTGKSPYRSFVRNSGGPNLESLHGTRCCRHHSRRAASRTDLKKRIESAPLDAHSEIDSIVLNAPVADVYAYCSRFEELPRFITSLRDVQKIDETHFSFTSLLDSEEYKTVLQIVLRVPERRIAWQAMPDNFPRGVVLFEPLSDRTTEITVSCDRASNQQRSPK